MSCSIRTNRYKITTFVQYLLIVIFCSSCTSEIVTGLTASCTKKASRGIDYSKGRHFPSIKYVKKEWFIFSLKSKHGEEVTIPSAENCSVFKLSENVVGAMLDKHQPIMFRLSKAGKVERINKLPELELTFRPSKYNKRWRKLDKPMKCSRKFIWKGDILIKNIDHISAYVTCERKANEDDLERAEFYFVAKIMQNDLSVIELNDTVVSYTVSKNKDSLPAVTFFEDLYFLSDKEAEKIFHQVFHY